MQLPAEEPTSSAVFVNTNCKRPRENYEQARKKSKSDDECDECEGEGDEADEAEGEPLEVADSGNELEPRDMMLQIFELIRKKDPNTGYFVEKIDPNTKLIEKKQCNIELFTADDMTFYSEKCIFKCLHCNKFVEKAASFTVMLRFETNKHIPGCVAYYISPCCAKKQLKLGIVGTKEIRYATLDEEGNIVYSHLPQGKFVGVNKLNGTKCWNREVEREEKHDEWVHMKEDPNTWIKHPEDKEIVDDKGKLRMKFKYRLLALRASMGLGKSYSIEKFVEWCGKYFDTILFVSTRCSLSASFIGIYRKYGFAHYEDGPEAYKANRLIIQYESLWKLQGHQTYDLVILDEMRSLCSNMQSVKTNHGEKLSMNAEMFRSLLENAQKCIVVDATLNWCPSVPFLLQTFFKPQEILLRDYTFVKLKRELNVTKKVNSFLPILDKSLKLLSLRKERGGAHEPISIICKAKNNGALSYTEMINKKFPNLRVDVFSGDANAVEKKYLEDIDKFLGECKIEACPIECPNNPEHVFETQCEAGCSNQLFAHCDKHRKKVCNCHPLKKLEKPRTDVLIFTSCVTCGVDIQVTFRRIFVAASTQGCSAHNLFQMMGRFRNLIIEAILFLVASYPMYKNVATTYKNLLTNRMEESKKWCENIKQITKKDVVLDYARETTVDKDGKRRFCLAPTWFSQMNLFETLDSAQNQNFLLFSFAHSSGWKVLVEEYGIDPEAYECVREEIEQENNDQLSQEFTEAKQRVAKKDEELYNQSHLHVKEVFSSSSDAANKMDYVREMQDEAKKHGGKKRKIDAALLNVMQYFPEYRPDTQECKFVEKNFLAIFNHAKFKSPDHTAIDDAIYHLKNAHPYFDVGNSKKLNVEKNIADALNLLGVQLNPYKTQGANGQWKWQFVSLQQFKDHAICIKELMADCYKTRVSEKRKKPADKTDGEYAKDWLSTELSNMYGIKFEASKKYDKEQKKKVIIGYSYKPDDQVEKLVNAGDFVQRLKDTHKRNNWELFGRDNMLKLLRQ